MKRRTTTKSASGSPAPAPTPASAPVAGEQMLLGSSTLPSLIEVGGEQVQLGTVVAAAQAASGLSVEDWNKLSEEARDQHLNQQVDAMRQRGAAMAEAEAERVRSEQEAAAQAERERLAAEEAAERQRAEEAAVQAAKPNEPKEAYPRRVLVLNNSSIPLVEPITGAHIQAGGKAPICLTDPDHAHRVQENLRAVLAQNYLPESVLDFEDLPG